MSRDGCSHKITRLIRTDGNCAQPFVTTVFSQTAVTLSTVGIVNSPCAAQTDGVGDGSIVYINSLVAKRMTVQSFYRMHRSPSNICIRTLSELLTDTFLHYSYS
jgi:hypothetical protein